MCICGNEKSYQECCGAIIEAKRSPNTPEELMRSRYSAYVIQEFSNAVEWLKLDVLSAKDETVEFKAYYRDKEGIQVLHEKSNFVIEDGIWRYKDGTLYTTKVQRNESCPCGSGKKFKKCCMK